MNIYVSHSKRFDYKTELYGPLKNSSLASEHSFVFPHDDSQTGADAKSLFENKKIDLIIAEVSHPATGQGIELGWANYNKIPVICVYKEDSTISASLKRITDQFISYSDQEDLIEKLTAAKF